MEEPIINCNQTAETFQLLLEAEPQQIDSEILRTLVEEVRNEETFEVNSYNRYHNRHNRSR
jgi:hypothetical protein